ncbi:MAG: hypothetical protein LUH07_11870 [Lachnospiraceae bacterium]|nr:hypothetical protein [Lachnospiraceae bacterium]
MDEQKKTLGRSRIYTGNPDGSVPEAAPEGGRRSRRAGTIGSAPKEHLLETSGRRRRDVETEARMRMLWGILCILIVILAVAIVYEIVLGNGTKETGAERMGTTIEETELIRESETEQETERTGENSTEQETEWTGENSTEQETERTGENAAEQETQTGQVSEANQAENLNEGTSVSASVTLAGLGE